MTYNPQPGDPEDISQIMSNFAQIVAEMNGNLEADTNIQTGVPVAQIGTTASEGSSNTLMRSDATLIIRGVEQLAADPVSPTESQLWWHTGENKLKAYDGSSIQAIGPLAATDIVEHASRHISTGADPIPAGGISNLQLGRTITATGNLIGNANINYGNGAYVDLMSVSITTTATQLVTVCGQLALGNQDTGSLRTANTRIYNATSSTVIKDFPEMRLTSTTASPPLYQAPVDLGCAFTLTAGTYTIKVQGATSAASTVRALYSQTDNTGNTIHPSIAYFVIG